MDLKGLGQAAMLVLSQLEAKQLIMVVGQPLGRLVDFLDWIVEGLG